MFLTIVFGCEYVDKSRQAVLVPDFEDVVFEYVDN